MSRRYGQITLHRALLVAVLACAWVPAGCRAPEPCPRNCHVDAELTERMHHVPGPVCPSGDAQVPPGVVLEDALTEEESIALALWNNAAYQELLAELGISRAQLVDAGLLTDPQLTIFFPLGPKQLEFAVIAALEAIWLRPIRIRAAELDLSRVADQMVQNGLNLVRDVRLAHADLLFAQRRSALAAEALELRKEIAEIAESRLRAGDISELEVTTFRVDVVQARVDAARFAQEVDLARERLKALLGLALADVEITAAESPLPPPVEPTSDELVREALTLRPDLRAAELAIEAAGVRAGLQRRQSMMIAGIIDANGQGRQGFEIGPGAQLTIPIFNGNRGQIALADAQLQQAMRSYVTVRDRIALDVRSAHIQAEQARRNLSLVRNELLPSVGDSVELARRNFERGETPYFLVLQSTSQFLDARTRELELEAALQRSVAELERSVGRRFLTVERSELELPPVPPSDARWPEAASTSVPPPRRPDVAEGGPGDGVQHTGGADSAVDHEPRFREPGAYETIVVTIPRRASGNVPRRDEHAEGAPTPADRIRVFPKRRRM